ncbi:hypothetical protein DITRI_Ditri13aG0009600 [Diplodiscus trichospermus]
MAFSQSSTNKSKQQYRKSGRSASSNQQRTSSGAYGKGAGRGPAPSPSLSSTSSLSSNRSFKKSNNAQRGQSKVNSLAVNTSEPSNSSVNIQNGTQVQPHLQGTSDAPIASAAAKPVDLPATQRSTRAVLKAPTFQCAVITSDSSFPTTPPEGDASTAFCFQFGSLDLDEQKRDQARHDSSSRSGSDLPTSVAKRQLPRKDSVASDQPDSGEAHSVPEVKKDAQASVAPPLNQTQKPFLLNMPMTSMHMPFHQSQSVTGSSIQMPMHMPLPMGNAPQVQRQVFVPDLQPRPLPPQGMMHQSQGLSFTPPLGGQLEPRLGNLGMGITPRYPQQQGGKFGVPRKTTPVKIMHPDTHEELRLDKRTDTYSDGGSSGPRSHPIVPSRSLPIPIFAPSHSIYYSNSMFHPPPSSLPLSGRQIAGNAQGQRLNYPVGEGHQNIAVMNSAAAHVATPDLSESTSKYEGEGVSLPSSKDKLAPELSRTKGTKTRGKKKRKEILRKADAAGTTSDLYMTYKGLEEKKETVIPSASAENNSIGVNLKQSTSTSNLASPDHQSAPVAILDLSGSTSKYEGECVSLPSSKDKPAPELSKTESTKTSGKKKRKEILQKADAKESEKIAQNNVVPDDWEDAAEIFTPKLETSDRDKKAHGGLVNHEKDGSGNIAKYSRDFLLKFAKQCTDLSQGFEIASDIAEGLMAANIIASHLVDHYSYPSLGRIIGRQSDGSRLDHRAERDLYCLALGGHGAAAGFQPGQGGNFGVPRRPRAQTPLPDIGGMLAAANHHQKGLLPSPQTPLQIMHKAEKKYEVGKVADEEESKQRQLRAILNKLSPQNFEKLFEQVKAVNIDNAGTLAGFVSQIYDKALMEPTFCEMYANLFYHLAGELSDFSEDNEKMTFKRLLLNKCQVEFEGGKSEQEEANKVEEEGEDKRRRMLGNFRLIGELYKKKMLTERLMHECIKKLLGEYENPNEKDVEAFCELICTIGKMIDHPRAKVYMDAYFKRMAKLSNNMKLSPKVRFMLMDAIDLRKNKWQRRPKVEGPFQNEGVYGCLL